MDNFFNKLNNVMGKKHCFSIVILILVTCVALTSVYVGFFAKKTPNDVLSQTSDVTINEDDGTIEIMDSSGVTTIPKYNIPISTYDSNGFVISDGIIDYTLSTTAMGIDVSSYQGEIDWAAVKEAGVDFAIIRCGYRGATQGKLNEDKYFQTNIQGAIDNGIKVGVYFFSQATTEAEAEEEAVFVLDLIRQYNITYPVVFDWEHVSYEDARIESVTGEETGLFANTFCKKIEKAGYQAMIYMNKYMAYNWYDLETISDYPIWIAEYEESSSFYYDFSIWQYTESGSVDGIDGNVDINIAMKPY